MASEIRAAEMRMQDLVSELARLEEELNRTRLERDDLRRVVGGLDAERDNLQVITGSSYHFQDSVKGVWGRVMIPM